MFINWSKYLLSLQNIKKPEEINLCLAINVSLMYIILFGNELDIQQTSIIYFNLVETVIMYLKYLFFNNYAWK